MRDNDVTLDGWDKDAGGYFECRYEACLTALRSEHMKAGESNSASSSPTTAPDRPATLLSA